MAELRDHSYVAIVQSHDDYGAKPLLTGIFTPVGEKNFDEKTLRKAGIYNNISIFTKTMIKPGRSLPVKEASKFYRETVKNHVSRYEEKSLMKLKSLPHLPLEVLTGPEFITMAIHHNLMAEDTLDQILGSHGSTNEDDGEATSSQDLQEKSQDNSQVQHEVTTASDNRQERSEENYQAVPSSDIVRRSMEHSFIHPDLGFIEVNVGGEGGGSDPEVPQVEEGAEKTEQRRRS